jgi:SpoIID/LytB domain protein
MTGSEVARVRIGILHQRDEIRLHLPPGTRLTAPDLSLPLEGTMTLRPVAVTQGRVRQALKVLECADSELLEQARIRFIEAGLPAVLRPHAPGGQWPAARAAATRLLALPIGGPVVPASGEHMRRELARPEDLPLLEETRRALGELAGRASTTGPPALWHLHAPARCRWTEQEPSGRLRLETPAGKSRECGLPARIVLPPGALAEVEDVRVGIGFHWDHRETLCYEDTLELWLAPEGLLGLVNELDLERYLASVNSSEMTADSPAELLRAQTVAARSTLLATRGRHHAGEPFDICADDHCQCFRGSGTVRAASEEAARATAGVVLCHEGWICDARYSKSCGGIVEAYEHVWEDQSVPYLPSFRDTCRPDPDFARPATEEGWRAWILADEEVWCNTEAFRLPTGLHYSDGFYRWRITLSRDEAAAHLRRATGRAFERLLDLVPLERGASGRLKRLLVRTDAGDFTIGKELAIRLALSATCLYSAAIVLDWEGDTLVIHGKGWGHGVGLCQLGATRMALEGRDWRGILRHYYPGAALAAL